MIIISKIQVLSFLVLLLSTLKAQEIFKPLPTQIQYDVEKVNLGRELFFEPLLSKNKKISCSSCHNQYGADKLKFSFGDDNKLGNINTTSVFNSTYNLSFFWNGRVSSLKEQLLDGPIYNNHEMNSSKNLILKRLNESQKYRKLFKTVYNRNPNFEDVIDSIVAFEKTLITPNSKFDRYLRNEIKLNKDEKKGFDLFNSYGCVSCHNGINIGGNSYQKFGTIIDYKSSDDQKLWTDRFAYTKMPKDKDVYRVPSLRNVVKTSPYFHSGDIKELKDAISLMAYYNLGIMLEEKELQLIEAFLNTLTGDLPKTWIKK